MSKWKKFYNGRIVHWLVGEPTRYNKTFTALCGKQTLWLAQLTGGEKQCVECQRRLTSVPADSPSPLAASDTAQRPASG